MAARTFADSAGTIWQVLEVHRSSTKPGAVSDGLELGWLSFTSGEAKRRLAPIPPAWESSPDPELERLCSAARVVPKPTHVFEPTSRDRRRKEGGPEEATDTGERRRTTDAAEARPPAAALEAASALVERLETVVEGEVRRFAHEARAKRLPAIDAMVQLKALLQEKFPEPDSEARDLRRIRRWFVEAYYFDREG